METLINAQVINLRGGRGKGVQGGGGAKGCKGDIACIEEASAGAKQLVANVLMSSHSCQVQGHQPPVRYPKGAREEGRRECR
jgi:hypothetical protein